jgi:diguanylate cyclase (GGDEF)-like protein
MAPVSGTPAPLPTILAEDALRRAHLLARSLLAALPGSALLVFDADLRVLLVEGPSAERLGIRTELTAGGYLGAALPPYLWPQLEPEFRAALAGTARRCVVSGRFDGKYAMSVVPVHDGDGAVIAGVSLVFDETDRYRTSEELERRLAQQSLVARLGELALRSTSFEALLEASCESVAEGLGVELVQTLEHHGDGIMEIAAGLGWKPGYIGARFEMESYRDARRANYHIAPVVIEDLPSDTQLRARPLRAHGVVSGATVGVGDGQAAFGLLGAYTRTRRSFTDHDLDFLRAVAHVIAAADERRRTEERLRHTALTDALTGLPNRTLLLDRLALALRHGVRTGAAVALFCLDLDNFKVVNDSLGHRAGDELLRAVGERLREALRPGDTVARFGGDEFAVLCEAVADEVEATRIADRIVAALEPAFAIEGAPRIARASIGLVLAAPGGGRAPEDLLADADAAMYRAKERGRGRWELFDEALRARLTARLRIEEDLRHALEHAPSQLAVAYQPIFRLADRGLRAVEALVRWHHPIRGLVPPGDFIGVAEESGLVVALGEHVLRTACRQVAEWRRSAPALDLRLTVNVSARQIAEPGIADVVADALAESGLPATALGLEITEGLLLEDSTSTSQTLQALRARGVVLVLDDFGTGYSSLGYLLRHPLDALKVDRSFVAALGEDGNGDGAIVEAIVGMARALGMPTIPEGVETEAQLARLRSMGCDFAQGFHLARPLPPEGIAALLRAATPEPARR